MVSGVWFKGKPGQKFISDIKDTQATPYIYPCEFIYTMSFNL